MSVEWMQGELEACKSLYFEGLSSRLIALKLNETYGENRSRNSIIGLINRQGWNLAPNAPRQPPSGLGRKRRKSASSVGSRVRKPKQKAQKMNLVLLVPQFKATEIVELLPPDNAAIPFCDLPPNKCRWLPGDPAFDALCCGADVVRGRSYCAYHMQRAYVMPKTRAQRQAEAAAARRARTGIPDLQARIA